jgi:putative colanic acid biosynthesis glycosyltransferase
MKKPQNITIVTVCLNDLERLKRTYRSILKQNYKNYQWLAIDGGSSDGTQDYLADTEAEWISESDSGLYDAMNKGLDRATGDYVVFMNAGDEFYDSQTLQNVASAIENSADMPDFIYGDTVERDHHGLMMRKAPSHTQKFRGMLVFHQAMYFRRDLIGGLRYDMEYRISADYDFSCRFMMKSNHILQIAAPLCIFESGGVSQQNALLGRREQYDIRARIGMAGPVQNAFIFAAQSTLWSLRSIAPDLYWRMRSSGKILPENAQTPSPSGHPESPA